MVFFDSAPFEGGTISNPLIETANGAASTPAMLLNGSIFTGGSGSTTWPQFLVQPTGTTSSAWSTSGTMIGANAPSGFGGRLIDLQVNGVSAFSVDNSGNINFGQPGFGTVSLFGSSNNLLVVGGLTVNNSNLTLGTPDQGSLNISCGNGGIGVTSTDKASIYNNAAAAAGAQQWSGRIRWTGQGWKTAATAGSQEVDFISELQTVQGVNNPTGLLAFSAQVNGAGYAQAFTIDTAGGIQTGLGVLNATGIWKLGALRTSTALVASTTQVIQVDIGGTKYSLMTCSSNP